MHVSRFLARRVLFLALGLLAVSSSPVFAAKEVFTRSKPHVNVGTVHGEPREIWFHANAGVFGGGDASGIVQLRVFDGESFLYRVTSGRAVLEQGTVVQLVLTLERVGEGGMATRETDLVIVRPSSTAADCLIYDFVGTEIHLEAEGHLTLRRRGGN